MDSTPNAERNLKQINGKTFLEAYETVVFAFDDIADEEKEKLCLKTLIDANHPVLCKFAHYHQIWEIILKKIKVASKTSLQIVAKIFWQSLLDGLFHNKH